MSKPNVAILHYAVPPVIGGVETTIAAHARWLRAHAYPVQLIAGRGDADVLIPLMDSRNPRAQAVQQELNRGIISADFHALVLELAAALEGALRDVDILIAHNVVTLHKNLALTTALSQLAAQPRVKLIAWCHDFAWDDPVYANDLHDGAPWALMKRAWANTKYVVVSEARRGDLARLLQLDAAEIAVIPPGIDAADFFQVSETTARWLKELRLLESAPLLLLPARVTRRKNIELAIDITLALRDKGYAPRLLVMGPPGPHNPANRAYVEELKTRAANSALVIFLQEHGVTHHHAHRASSPLMRDTVSVDDATRRDLYALADALLFPSTREGFGIPLLEAGIARLPIFCADLLPFHETARAFAHYFDLHQAPQDIAASLAEFFENDARYQLKQRVRKNYLWEQLMAAHVEPLLMHHAKF